MNCFWLINGVFRAWLLTDSFKKETKSLVVVGCDRMLYLFPFGVVVVARWCCFDGGFDAIGAW